MPLFWFLFVLFIIGLMDHPHPDTPDEPYRIEISNLLLAAFLAWFGPVYFVMVAHRLGIKKYDEEVGTQLTFLKTLINNHTLHWFIVLLGVAVLIVMLIGDLIKHKRAIESKEERSARRGDKYL